MNMYIDAQCKQMTAMVNTFVHACEMAAKQDDGHISREEEKVLRKIRNAAQKFQTEIGKL